ncbi:MAG: hypothetical protein EBZ60_03705 [Betaproteobacteria bacterium]|nr:hypothetical protein [Betaproteobacteria bacterium]
MTLGYLVGCGGGGSSLVEPIGNPHLVSADARINSPKLMALVGSDIYVANQGNRDAAGALKIDASDQLTSVGFSNLRNAIGVAVNSAEVYVSGIPGSGIPGILNLSTGSPLVNTNGSHYGFVFTPQGDLVAPSVNTSIGVSLANTNYASWNSIGIPDTPLALVKKGNFIYISTQGNQILKMDSNNLSASPQALNLTGLQLESPNGIAFDGDTMYVVNHGPVGGTKSWIAKITNESVVSEFKRDPNWLCASAGIAVRDNYIYISNGTATATGCGNIQNTIVKFYH